jgi:hypothetical protein
MQTQPAPSTSLNRPASLCRRAAALLLAALVAPALVARAAAPAAPAAPASTNASPAAPVPQSVFVIPSSPKQGRNPFFPRSTFAAAAAPAKAEAIDTSGVVLNGLTSPPRVTAMINGRTFEPGERGEIRLRNGAKVMVHCLEIKSDVVVAIIGAQRCELRMRHAL